MDFARKQLEKYGWTDGKGLGKHENGISEALKPKLKRSVAGIGHDAAADFTEHWWTTLYNKAAGNVQVEEKNGKTKKIKTKDDKFKITNSTWKLNKKSKDSEEQDEYSEYFIRKALLLSGGSKIENVNADSESEEEVKETKDVTKMTDEELFAACGGRTAHKGARHGLRATGKLARIERQEQILLGQPQYNGYSHAKKNRIKNLSVNDLVIEDVSLNSDMDHSEIKKKKKKRKRCLSKDDNTIEINNSKICYEPSVKDMDATPNDNFENDNSEIQNQNNKDKKVKKSKRKAVDIVNVEDNSIICHEPSVKEIDVTVNDNLENDNNEIQNERNTDEDLRKSKRKAVEIINGDNVITSKKKKHKNCEASVAVDNNIDEDKPKVKKNRKKHSSSDT